jgi:hypothetical protein
VRQDAGTYYSGFPQFAESLQQVTLYFSMDSGRYIVGSVTEKHLSRLTEVMTRAFIYPQRTAMGLGFLIPI